MHDYSKQRSEDRAIGFKIRKGERRVLEMGGSGKERMGRKEVERKGGNVKGLEGRSGRKKKRKRMSGKKRSRWVKLS